MPTKDHSSLRAVTRGSGGPGGSGCPPTPLLVPFDASSDFLQPRVRTSGAVRPELHSSLGPIASDRESAHRQMCTCLRRIVSASELDDSPVALRSGFHDGHVQESIVQRSRAAFSLGYADRFVDSLTERKRSALGFRFLV